jgi:8-oxo-dGTP pyrophosphatase MutT (NUDIX family)
LAFVDSYLWRLRQKIGSELVLMPGAMVVLQRDDGQVLLTKRADTGAWCLPAGGAEPGGSFAQTAIDELFEETGVQVAAENLIPFGCLSEAAHHTIHYPNGDTTHCFAVCFLARDWHGDPRPDHDETTEIRFAELDDPPQPLQGPAASALELFREFSASGDFQAR